MHRPGADSSLQRINFRDPLRHDAHAGALAVASACSLLLHVSDKSVDDVLWQSGIVARILEAMARAVKGQIFWWWCLHSLTDQASLFPCTICTSWWLLIPVSIGLFATRQC